MDIVDITLVVFTVLLFVFAFGAGFFFGRAKERNESRNQEQTLDALLPRCTCKNPSKTWCKGCLMREVAKMEGGEK